MVARGSPAKLRSTPPLRTEAKSKGGRGVAQKRKTMTTSFQIRTKPEVYQLAMDVAAAHTTQRSKLDGEIYELGLYLKTLLMGPEKDGTYAGMSSQDLAKRLSSPFPTLYAFLDENYALPSFVYRVLSPQMTGAATMHLQGAVVPSPEGAPEKAATYDVDLSDQAEQDLDNFPDL